jgi:hypothetical protein
MKKEDNNWSRINYAHLIVCLFVCLFIQQTIFNAFILRNNLPCDKLTNCEFYRVNILFPDVIYIDSSCNFILLSLFHNSSLFLSLTLSLSLSLPLSLSLSSAFDVAVIGYQTSSLVRSCWFGMNALVAPDGCEKREKEIDGDRGM